MVFDSKNISKVNSPERRAPLEFHRNFGIAAHIDAGKTTTSERILFYSGKIHKMGEVHDGGATTDWMEQEKERGITITAAAITTGWRTTEGPRAGIEHVFNIIDTPGHVDFTAEVERSMRVLDGAIAVFCAVAGVQPQSETVWRQMNKYHVPRICFVNKMDRTGADYYNAFQGIKEKLGGNPHPLYLPIGAADSFTGLIDLVAMKAHIYDPSDSTGRKYDIVEIPSEYKEQAQKYHDKLVEEVASHDDDLATKFLEGETLTRDEIMLAIRKATLSMNFVGVIPGSAFKNKGVQQLLNAVVDYLPGPMDVPPMKGTNSNDEVVEVHADDTKKVCGLVFKLWTDPFIGKLTFFRVYQGVLRKGAALTNPRTRKVERISRLVHMHADRREDIDAAYAGDICAIIGAKEVRTGDTLIDQDIDIMLEPPTFPQPVISMSVEPKTKSDQERLSIGLGRLAEEDPTFVVSTNQETGQTIISGMGELHLDIIRDRLFREHKVEAEVGKPMINYRETITVASAGVGKFIRQSGGRGQYGHAEIKMEPNEKGKGYEFINEIVGGVIPKEYIKPTEEGIREAAQNGTIAGYPVIDFKVRLTFGSFHEVDSNELAFRMAGIFAFREAMQKAGPILLEPIMKVEVTCPEDFQGDVVGDLNRRRGQINTIESKNNAAIIHANVPLETMFGYATDVRSITKGRASYSMEPSHYEQVPAQVLKKVQEANANRAAART